MCNTSYTGSPPIFDSTLVPDMCDHKRVSVFCKLHKVLQSEEDARKFPYFQLGNRIHNLHISLEPKQAKSKCWGSYSYDLVWGYSDSNITGVNTIGYRSNENLRIAWMWQAWTLANRKTWNCNCTCYHNRALYVARSSLVILKVLIWTSTIETDLCFVEFMTLVGLPVMASCQVSMSAGHLFIFHGLHYSYRHIPFTLHLHILWPFTS